MFDIKEKNVLITGATSGIGKAAALKLSSLGAKICFIARNEKKAEDLAKEIDNLMVLTCDVSTSQIFRLKKK